LSRIKGLNDSTTLLDRKPKASIKVWKGEKKGDRSAGKNLELQFRIEAPERLRSLIKSAYNATQKGDSLYVDHLNLTPAYDDELRAFDSKMALYNASRPIHFCDRESIYLEYQEVKDPFGGINFQPSKCNKPCPVAGSNFECPNKCSRVGDFYFYIWELMEAGYADFARLQVHGVEDNQHIAQVLDEVKDGVGSIRFSPFVHESSKSNIIYTLSRREVKGKYPIKQDGIRTNKRGEKADWVVNLSLQNDWFRRYQSYLQTQQLRSLNYQPSMRLIEEVHGTGLIEGTIDVAPLLPSSDLTEFKRKLAIVYRSNGWDQESWQKMMIDNFGTTEVSSDIDLDLLMAIANRENLN
jgi:hypothetical protein